MEFITHQISFHEYMVQIHTNQIESLNKLLNKPISNPNHSTHIDNPVSHPNHSTHIDNPISSPNHSTHIIDDQELVWDRIRRAHPERYNTSTNIPVNNEISNIMNTSCVNSTNSTNVNNVTNSTNVNNVTNSTNAKLEKKNNIKEHDPYKLLQDMPTQISTQTLNNTDAQDTQTINNTVNKPLLVTRLSKFTYKKQNQIIKNIFLKAKINIETLAELDNTIKLNMEEKIKEEADRLLNLYLNDRNGI